MPEIAVRGVPHVRLLIRSGWESDAACDVTDPDAFHPTTGKNVDQAKAQCAGCPVRLDCLNTALVNREKEGLWGGLLPHERDELLTELATVEGAS